MKIAYLIPTFTDAPHLARLIQALDDGAEFFVHVDAKTDIGPFRRLAAAPNVHFLERRFRVLWGDISQVRYQQALLRACMDFPARFDRICLLSGQDYPLWPKARLRRFFEENRDRDFIAGIRLRGQRPEVTRNYRLRRPQVWLPGLGTRTNCRLRVACRHLLRLLGARKPLTLKVDGREMDVYKGTDWWSCTPRTARFMLDELDRHPEILRFFRTMFVPSELVWPTLVFNSPHADRAIRHEGDYRSLADLTPLHYIDYDPVIKVLTLDDWDRLRQADKPFFRKAVTGASDALMDRVDEGSGEWREERGEWRMESGERRGGEGE